MGGRCTQSYTEIPSEETLISGTQIPAWVAAGGRGLFAEAVNSASNPYPVYEGARVMDYGGSKLTEDERAGASILREGAESYLPYMNRASEVANTLGQGYDGMSESELLGDPFEGSTREELLGDPFSLETAQPFMDIYFFSLFY